MAGKQIYGEELPASLAGMSKDQLYNIMCQMKTLLDQNKQQARNILIQNPVLTRTLFQAQIVLGMVQSPQAAPIIPPSTPQHSQPSSTPNQTPSTQATSSFPSQTSQNPLRKQQPNAPQPTIPSNPQPNPMPPKISQPIQQPKVHIAPQPPPMAAPQASQVPNLPHHQPTIPTQSQPHMQNSGSQYLPLQPPLPPQPRPQMPAFPHQGHAQMGQNMGFQNPSGPGPQMQYQQGPQHVFHSGPNPNPGLGPSFPRGQPPFSNQNLPPPIHQAGGSHLGMEFNQVGSSNQIDRGSNWMPGMPENMQIRGPPPPFTGQMGPTTNQPPRPPPLIVDTGLTHSLNQPFWLIVMQLTSDLEKALLQQVMSLTPEQINILPPDQRNQILQLQQMLRQ